MSESSNISSEGLSPAGKLYNVRQFITRVWEHPLLDNETRFHRQNFIGIAQDVMHYAGLSDEDYIAIPVGGSRWAVESTPEHTSDYDAFTFFSDTVPSKVNWEKFHEISEQLDFDRANTASFKINRENVLKGVELLFTPDEYVVGNIEKAREMRLEILKLIKEIGGQEFWKNAVDYHFRLFIVWWDRNVHLPPHIKPEEFVGKRTKRLNEHLAIRASQSRNPQKYIERFDHARRKMTLPDFDIYYGALQTSKGELTILPDQIAQGIEE